MPRTWHRAHRTICRPKLVEVALRGKSRYGIRLRRWIIAAMCTAWVSCCSKLLTGERPFQGKTLAELFEAITQAEVPSATELCPDIPTQLDRVCRRTLAKNPDERFQTAEDLRDQLRAISDACKQTQLDAEQARDLQGSNRGFWIAGGILLAIGLGIAAFLITRNIMAPSNSIAPQGTNSENVQVAAASDDVLEQEKQKHSDAEQRDRSVRRQLRATPGFAEPTAQPANAPLGAPSKSAAPIRQSSRSFGGGVKAESDIRPSDAQEWLDLGQEQLAEKDVEAAKVSFTAAFDAARQSNDVQLTTMVIADLAEACESTEGVDEQTASELQLQLLRKLVERAHRQSPS